MAKEIILIIVGIIVVIVSFMMSEKKSAKEEEQEKLDSETLKSELKSEIIESVKLEQKNLQTESENFLEGKQTDILDKMEDEMSRLSNEKIMSFSEYGEQILGKIEQNHQEVVFLYDMLNQKETEMKQLIREIDSSKINLEEMLITVKEEEKEWETWKKEKEETMQELARKEIALQKVMAEGKKLAGEKEKEKNEKKKMGQEEEKVPVLTAADILAAKKEGKTIDYFSALKKNNDRGFEELKVENKKAEHVEKVENASQIADRGPAANIDGPFSFGEISMGSKEDPFSDEFDKEKKNLNESVLELYAQGMSVMEIAKILGRGQGEVKLIIDLYQGSKM